ncbi:MAG: PDP protein, partial [Sulfurimonas sp. RIFOXYD12_FULL_36_11]
MKIFFIVLFTLASLNALETSDKLFECTEIFKARKSELLVELERIDEQKQALSALKTATEELLKKREAKVSQDEEVVSLKLKEIASKEESIKKMLQKNEETLKEIKDIKMSNITQTFSKMKAASTANVLSEMNPQEAASIL